MMVDRDDFHTYILPRPHGEIIVGGTIQPHDSSLDNRAEDIDAIWSRACALEPLLKSSKRLGVHCGLRPQRTNGICLQVDPQRLRNSQQGVLIHNYGHVGSGHTLHWGCAQDVVQLAQRYVTPTSRL